MLASLVLIGLFAWNYFSGTTDLNYTLYVPLTAATAAGVTFGVTLLLYLIAPLNRTGIASLASYALLVISLLLLLLGTRGIASAFLGLFIATIPFASFFGMGGAFVGYAGVAVLMVWEYLTSNPTPGQLLSLALMSTLPLVGGFILWGRTDPGLKESTKEDRSYNELASELSQVAGKSEVVINAITDGVLALDSKGLIQLINPAAQQLVGWGKHDALTLSYKSVIKLINSKNTEATELEDPVAQVLSTNKPVKTDALSIQTQSGKSFMAAVSVSPVGQPGSGVIVVFRDVTDEKSDERQRAEFISTASHEMRTPVASIEGYLGLALNPATAQIDAKARDFINKAHESAQHLGSLFQDLLDVSKADDNRLQNNPTVIDVVPFIGEIVEGHAPKAAEKGLRMMYKPMPNGEEDDTSRRLNPVFYVNVDRAHLREVADNLVDNAIKYTPSGDVVIDISGDSEHVTISVADTGIGIPREDQAHLFQKFYRVDSSDTREIGGTGLGLYLCRRLAETMGGRIWAESEYKKGSTFYVELPRIEHDEAMRLIEQASIFAEQRAEADAAKAARDAEAQKVAEQQAIQAPVASFTPAQPQQVAPLVVAPTTPIAAPAPQIATPQPQQPTPAQPNTPISAIEANPTQFTSRRTIPINVPPRQQ